MKLQIYTIFDRKMVSYMKPMYPTHLVEIQRNLTEVMKDENANIAKFPEDYELYRLGEWDTESAEYILENKPVFIQQISEFKPKTPTEK